MLHAEVCILHTISCRAHGPRNTQHLKLAIAKGPERCCCGVSNESFFATQFRPEIRARAPCLGVDFRSKMYQCCGRALVQHVVVSWNSLSTMCRRALCPSARCTSDMSRHLCTLKTFRIEGNSGNPPSSRSSKGRTKLSALLDRASVQLSLSVDITSEVLCAGSMLPIIELFQTSIFV